MPHTYVSILTHIVFSTKDRLPQIDTALEDRLFPYFAKVLKELNGALLKVNGIPDHVHLLASLPATVPVAVVVKEIKGSSSLWIHETFVDRRHFTWQRGYSAFSVSPSYRDKVAAYIENQKTHHGKIDFKQELLALLRRHGIEPDERYLWR